MITDDEIEAAARALVAGQRKMFPGGGWFALSDAMSLMRDALTAAAAVRGDVAVAVKPLEWREVGELWQADTSIGWYSIRPDEADGFTHSLFLSASPIRSFKNVDAAKATAQADYEARIRSALVPTKSYEDGVRAAAQLHLDMATEADVDASDQTGADRTLSQLTAQSHREDAELILAALLPNSGGRG